MKKGCKRIRSHKTRSWELKSWTPFSVGAEAAYHIHHPLEPHRHLLCLQPATKAQNVSTIQGHHFFNEFSGDFFATRNCSGLDDSGSWTLSLQCSQQSACSAGLVTFTMQLKPCVRQGTRTEFPSLPKTLFQIQVPKWCASRAFWQNRTNFFGHFCWLGRSNSSHRQRKVGRHGQLPRLSGRLPRPQTAGRPGADQGTLPKRQELPDVRVRLP